MSGGGGPIYVNRLDRPGRFDLATCSYVHGHSGAVNDIDWSPFDDTMMATGSEDTRIKLWQIPEDWEPTDEHGNAHPGKQLSESLIELQGHRKKVTLLRYHPTANNTLLSTSGDYSVKLWDIEAATEAQSFEGCDNLIHDIIWDYNGDQYAVSCKDKSVRIVDPRANTAAALVHAHEGAKSIKLVYANDSGKLFSFGASKQSSREIKVWDVKKFDKPIHTETVDTAAGAMIPLWDSDTNVLYLCGKGDGIVRLYEYEDKSPFIFKLNDGFRSNIPGKGYCLVPKRGLNIMSHETARILKVTNSAGVHPLKFEVPRKSDAFQDDIFPPTAAPVPSHSFAEWFKGSSKEPIKMSLDPKDGNSPRAPQAAAKLKAFKPAGSAAKELTDAKNSLKEMDRDLEAKERDLLDTHRELEVTKKTLGETQKTLDDANARIEFLEGKLKEHNIDV